MCERGKINLPEAKELKKAKAKVIHTTGQVTREKGVETKKKRKLTLQRKNKKCVKFTKEAKGFVVNVAFPFYRQTDHLAF